MERVRRAPSAREWERVGGLSPLVVQVLDADTGSAIDAAVSPPLFRGPAPVWLPDKEPGSLWAEEPGTWYVSDGSEWFAVAWVSWPRDGSPRVAVEVEDARAWRAGGAAAERAPEGAHPSGDVVRGDDWECRRCGAVSADAGLFAEVGCMPR